jgi:hypothetical protein
MHFPKWDSELGQSCGLIVSNVAAVANSLCVGELRSVSLRDEYVISFGRFTRANRTAGSH